MAGEEARKIIESAIRRELYGPDDIDTCYGTPLDCSSGTVEFLSNEETGSVYYDQSTGQEILTHSDPLHRYGVGVLHPACASKDNQIDEETPICGLPSQESTVELAGQKFITEPDDSVADSDDFDLSDANKYKPSSMAISFKCRIPSTGSFLITVKGAYYDKLTIRKPNYANTFTWWIRRPFKLKGLVTRELLMKERQLTEIVIMPEDADQIPRVKPTAQIFSRTLPKETDQDSRLVTVSISNTTSAYGPENALFQAHFQIEATGDATFEPYPEEQHSIITPEEETINLLYRKRLTYAVGHGCAATWKESSTVNRINAEPMPYYEVPNLTPDISIPETEKKLQVSMRELAMGTDTGNNQVQQLLSLYENWIEQEEKTATGLGNVYQSAAKRNLQLCKTALRRMQDGWKLVIKDNKSDTAQAFRWMNQAMLYQQLHSRLPLRKVTYSKEGTGTFNPQFSEFSPLPDLPVQPGLGNWRPFQIAFILAILPELVDKTQPTRSTVDLIYFPTGGGKTEAYLGASAFSLLLRRLKDPEDCGTDTIMRYTLRLLTTQQFQRAASLICVLERIRADNPSVLGEKSFSIGAWLGGSTTPNHKKDAIKSLEKMYERDTANPFLLLRCPWCGAQMGPVRRPHRRGGNNIFGYEKSKGSVRFRCADPNCWYSHKEHSLPIYVVDEDIYEQKPSIVIGTVDKFAMLAWVPEAKSIFGRDGLGKQQCTPPNLIIQDELHLISGPLGSMIGLYEPVIDELCTDHRDKATPPVPPKIIASTATARRYEEQILALYGREVEQTAIFPPHGLEEGHSFFAEPEVDDEGLPTPGRRYLGIFSASLGSTQTVQVRVAASTLEAALNIPKENRDGYWTNLNFFNSLRELGNTVTLLQSDVPDYLTGLRNRDHLSEIRWPRQILELTSRKRNDEIPRAIEQLAVPYGNNNSSIDICLSSNIIEVGIDIDRLGLMTIVGQPKTTAQYIQVSGRVGRKPNISPGLVITIYGASKPRDRSHFEHFQTYHERLYAQVEPTSVTPFAHPVLKRALHAAILAYIRQTNSSDMKPYPFPKSEFNQAAQVIIKRAELSDPSSKQDVIAEIDRIQQNWENWERTEWSANPHGGNPKQGLMMYAGLKNNADSQALVWEVPTSMRNVDAECELEISLSYAAEDGRGKDNQEQVR